MKCYRPIILTRTREGCHICEVQDRYNVYLYGKLFFQLYFNLRGYVGYLPAPPEKIGDLPLKLSIGERAIYAWRKEIAVLNREWLAYEKSLASAQNHPAGNA